MTAIEILRAASRSVPNEDYVQFMAAVEAVAEVIEAAREYFNGYCQDEADDEFSASSDYGTNTGCTLEQSLSAERLRDSLANVGGAA